MKKQLLLILLFVFIPATTAMAVKISSLYQAEVAVSAQTEAAKVAAAKQGLLAVLVRMSGNTQIDKNPEITHAVANADDFIQAYHYSSAPGARQLLTLQFNKGGINLLLKSAGITKWSDERPLVLVWVTQLSPRLESEILSNHSQNELINLLHQESNRLGLPLVFPVMDMADAAQLSAHDISAFNLSILKDAGRRYTADAMLIGSLEPGENKLQSHWHLVVGDKQWEWKLSETSLALMVTHIMEQASQVLAANYVVPQQNVANQHVATNMQNEFDDKPVEGWTF